MKTISFFIQLTFFLMMFCVYSQKIDYEISLSKPGATGALKVDVPYSEIVVNGYDGDTILISIIDNREKKNRGKLLEAQFYFQILENNNHVTILHKNPSKFKMKGIDIELMVPRNFSANLSTRYGRQIEVSGIYGEVEIAGYFTDIKLQDLEQNVIVNTNKGDIIAHFTSIDKSDILFLSNYKGNIQVTFPKKVEATLLIDNYRGKINTSFKLNTNNSNREDLKSSRFVRRDINGGGKEIKIINYFGNISINASE